MIILFVFAETKIIKKVDSCNGNQPKFLFFRKVLADSNKKIGLLCLKLFYGIKKDDFAKKSSFFCCYVLGYSASA